MVNGTPPQVVYGEQFQTPTANLQDANPVQLTELKFIQNGTKVTLFAKIRNTVSDAIAKDVFLRFTPAILMATASTRKRPWLNTSSPPRKSPA